MKIATGKVSQGVIATMYRRRFVAIQGDRLCDAVVWTCHLDMPHPFVRSRDTPVQSRGSIQGLGLGGLDDMRDMACLTSDIDGWRMFLSCGACDV